MLLLFCGLPVVHRESHRSHTGQRFCKQDMLARLDSHKRMFDESSTQGWRVLWEGPQALLYAYNTKHAAPLETSSLGNQKRVLHFHLKLLMVPTVRSVRPCTAYAVVVPWSPSQTAQRTRWHFFPWFFYWHQLLETRREAVGESAQIQLKRSLYQWEIPCWDSGL